MRKTYGPYSPYQQAGALVFTAGQIGVKDGVAPIDIQTQTQQALDNLASVLQDAGSALKQVIKTTVFLTDMGNFTAMNEVYARVFEEVGSKPARSTVAVSELPRVAGDTPLLVEIEAVASKEKS